MDIKKIHEYCSTFKCTCNDGPLDYFYSPAMKNGYVANAKWRPLGGAEW
jgi:hypothetical protein|nr:MAG TPA: hypothetical protein [Bacteriophage sp.]